MRLAFRRIGGRGQGEFHRAFSRCTGCAARPATVQDSSSDIGREFEPPRERRLVADGVSRGHPLRAIAHELELALRRSLTMASAVAIVGSQCGLQRELRAGFRGDERRAVDGRAHPLRQPMRGDGGAQSARPSAPALRREGSRKDASRPRIPARWALAASTARRAAIAAPSRSRPLRDRAHPPSSSARAARGGHRPAARTPPRSHRRPSPESPRHWAATRAASPLPNPRPRARRRGFGNAAGLPRSAPAFAIASATGSASADAAAARSAARRVAPRSRPRHPRAGTSPRRPALPRRCHSRAPRCPPGCPPLAAASPSPRRA